MDMGRGYTPLRNLEQWSFIQRRRWTMPLRKVRPRGALLKAKDETKATASPRKKRPLAFRSLPETNFRRLSKEQEWEDTAIDPW